VKVAAYQAPLAPAASMSVLDRIRARVAQCEAEGVGLLCCPEAVLGGLADDAADPRQFALDAESGELETALAPIAGDTVTTIVGFTEIAGGRLFNSAAVFHRGSVVGIYRKRHPAINRSVYEPGTTAPVFTIGGLRFGIVICNDSNFDEPAQLIGAQGAKALFVPTNNALPPHQGGADLVAEARRVDIATATARRMWVVRADVAGRCGGLASHGSSAIVSPGGTVVQCARTLMEDLIVAEIGID
jgi:predicted amidohydrolase